MKRYGKICKVFAIIAVMALTMGCLSACTDKSAGEGSTAQAAESSTGKTEDKSSSESKAAVNTTNEKKDDAKKDDAKSEDKAAEKNSTEASDKSSSDTASKPDNSAAAAPVVDTIKVKTENESGYTKEGGIYTITKGGEYKFKGELSEGQIIVDAKGEEVVIALNGVDITCSYDSVIYVKHAEEVTIKALDGTTNILRDVRPRRVDEEEDAGSACIYSKDDLKFQGKGLLQIEASYNNGIHSKNDIKIKNLTLTVTCPNNCIKGNDSITIESGFITVTSLENDGLKTKNIDVSSKGKQRGIITISGGTVTINAPSKCINAAFGKEISENATVIKNKTEQ